MNIPYRVSDIRYEQLDEQFKARLTLVLLDNNLIHDFNPSFVASQEQLGFMVHLTPDQVYLPCSDETFFDMCRDRIPWRLARQYGRVWRVVKKLLQTLPTDESQKKYAARFCRQLVCEQLAAHRVLPSRLMKRLTGLATFLTGCSADQWATARAQAIRWQRAVLQNPMIQEELNRVDQTSLPMEMDKLTAYLKAVLFARYACLAANTRNWSQSVPESEKVRKAFCAAESAFSRCPEFVDLLGSEDKTILLCCDADGGSVYDLQMASVLLSCGHRVIYAVKGNAFFHSPTIDDMRDNLDLRELFAKATICANPNLSKNELLDLLSSRGFVVISDGTRERMNLARTSVTFARAWKEADMVITRGWRNRHIFCWTSHTFTRDILCFEQKPGVFSLKYRKHDPAERKFSKKDITAVSDTIIAQMRAARDEGKTIVFYSCIVGSIPGEVERATRIVTAFLKDLRARNPQAWIINPSEHFIEGMDGDDLMYMWERVQRSGLIAVWRFQTAEDIEKGFELLHEQIPSIWLGKDSTYSTGCTQEMHIAMDVQKKNPEMQIIGPAPERFSRRSKYGVGKYFDDRLANG